ncbi:tubulin alpha chain [Eurytemora carolleeae]|uniref:tubulin alpha chain n=1 Tax=Eurytemora carolleeae TaxID=1294199 RepID=UPI000C75CF25|nr:tubulin alpha chain [Eurytemora carolleeae]|eukprot:XP_023324878.1 tubulin alpha chain-like [Eurytemora affinis]
MSRECISIHVGQAGCQMGSNCWELYGVEHGVGPDGLPCLADGNNDLTSFYSTTGTGKYVLIPVILRNWELCSNTCNFKELGIMLQYL